MDRKRATETRPVDDNLDELLEMQRFGIKVALPKVKVRRVIVDSLEIQDVIHESPQAVSSAGITTDDLQDLVDLAELGGNPTWPHGLNCNTARDELRRRLSLSL